MFPSDVTPISTFLGMSETYKCCSYIKSHGGDKEHSWMKFPEPWDKNECMTLWRLTGALCCSSAPYVIF